MQEHLRNAFRKGHDTHRHHRCKLSPMILHAMTAPSPAAKGGDDMQGQRHLRTHAGEAGTKEGAVIETDGSRRADDPGSGWPDPATTG
jgi:hypothetical protein